MTSHETLKWLCTFLPEHNTICGKLFDSSKDLNDHARISHTKYDHEDSAGKVHYSWWCGTCSSYIKSYYTTHYRSKAHVEAESLRQSSLYDMHISNLVNNTATLDDTDANDIDFEETNTDTTMTDQDFTNDLLTQLHLSFNSLDNINNDESEFNTTISEQNFRDIVPDPVLNIHAALDDNDIIKDYDYETEDKKWQNTQFDMTSALYLIVLELKISKEKFVAMCSIFHHLSFSTADVPKAPRVWYKQMFQFEEKNNTYTNKGPVPVAPIYKYERNKSRGFIIDMVHTLRYQILAHPERSVFIKNDIPSFRPDGVICTFNHTALFHQCAMLATRKLENEHGVFKHGHLLSYFINNKIQFGILLSISENEIDETDIRCRIQRCITNTELPQQYHHVIQSKFGELYLTEQEDIVTFAQFHKPEQLYTLEEWNTLSLIEQYKIYTSYFSWVPYSHHFPEPANIQENTITIPIKWHIDGTPVTSTVPDAYNFSFWVPNCFPLDIQSQLHNLFLFGAFEKGFPLYDVVSLLLDYFYNWFHKGVEMYHAHLQRNVIIKCVLVITVSDQPMGNALTGIRLGGGANGNRHFYHSSQNLHNPIQNNMRRDEVLDEFVRKELYADLSQNLTSKANREKKASKIGISEANYSTLHGTPFIQYFKCIGLAMYRSFPNCTLHVLYLNIGSYMLTLLTSILNAEGQRLLHIAAQSDLLPDDFGTNTNKTRLRNFPENIRSLVGGDIATLLPRLPVLFRLVLRKQFLRQDVCDSLLRNEESNNYLSVRILLRRMTCCLIDLSLTKFQIIEAVSTMTEELNFRKDFTRIFTEKGAKPSHPMLDILANVEDRIYCGSGYTISTAFLESAMGEPKHTKTNHKDVAKIVVEEKAIRQAVQAAFTGSTTQTGALAYPQLYNLKKGMPTYFLGIKAETVVYDQSTDWIDMNLSPIHVYGDVKCTAFERTKQFKLIRNIATNDFMEILRKKYNQLFGENVSQLTYFHLASPKKVTVREKLRLRIGSSVETPEGNFAIKEIYVHKFNNEIDHCWIVGRRWTISSMPTLPEIPYPLISLQNNDTELFNASSILNIILCTHLCMSLTYSDEDFQASVNNPTLKQYCHIGTKIVHTPHINVFVKQPYNKSTY